MKPLAKEALGLTAFVAGTFGITLISALTVKRVIENPNANNNYPYYVAGGCLLGSGAILYVLNKHKLKK